MAMLTLFGRTFSIANFLPTNDSGFETSVGDWTVQGNCTIAQDATWAHSGTNSLKLTPTGVGPQATILNTTLAIPVVGGAQYQIDAWGTAAGGLTRNFATSRATFTATPTFIGFSSSTNVPLSVTAGTWVAASPLVFTAEGNARWLQLSVTSSNMTNGGTEFLWVDDVTVRRIG